MTVRGRYGLGKLLLTHANELVMLDMLLTTLIASLLVSEHFHLLKLGAAQTYINGFLNFNQFFKAVIVIVMAFESLMVHTMGPEKHIHSASCACQHTQKRTNDGSGPFVNKYNRMEQAQKEEAARESDVMGLDDADKQKTT